MSKEVTAAILTQIYFRRINAETEYAFSNPDNRGCDPRKIKIIGTVYAGFLKALPKFEKRAEGKESKG